MRPVLAILCGVVLVAAQAAPPGADARFASFFRARTPDDIAAASDAIAAAGVSFDEAFARLKRGRVYTRDVPRGVVQGSYRSASGEYFYTLDVPETYDPAHQYQIRIELHGGVGRIESSAPPRQAAGSRLRGAQQI